jgi:hypothetical protein
VLSGSFDHGRLGHRLRVDSCRRVVVEYRRRSVIGEGGCFRGHATLTDARRPAIRDGDLYQPMWPELEALVGSAMRAANLLAERSPLLPSDGLRRSIAQVGVP